MTSVAGTIPVPACVLFLRMQGFAQAAPEEQSDRREQLAAALQAALPLWTRDRRVVLEAPDGLALVGEVAPTVALVAARQAAQHAADERVGIALHHGPVRAVADAAGGTRVVGDGIETAGALAGFPGERGVVASQAFRDALAAEAPRQAEGLRHAGERVDERLRPHALFVDDPAPARHRALRRNLLAAGGVLLLLAAGYAGRVGREHYAASHRPAVLVLDVQPSGEIFVDGERKGMAPPLVRLSLPPGPHAVEVRNARFKPLQVDVQLQPGEEMQLKHTFVPPPAPRRGRSQQPKHEPGLLDRFKFW